MAPIRPQLLVSHANHSANETSIRKDVQWTDDIRGDQKPRGPDKYIRNFSTEVGNICMYV